MPVDAVSSFQRRPSCHLDRHLYTATRTVKPSLQASEAWGASSILAGGTRDIWLG